MDSADPVARNLKQIRLDRQWSLEDAALATGFDASVLEGLERGSTFLSRARLRDLARRLDVAPADLGA